MPRTILIGDIHSCAEELFELLHKVSPAPADIIIAVGDLVDRGQVPWSVIEFFLKSNNCLAILGNHERKHLRNIMPTSQTIIALKLGHDKYQKAKERIEGKYSRAAIESNSQPKIATGKI